jgi:cytidylate kinase
MPDPVGGVLPTSTLPDARANREQTERVHTDIADGAGGVVLGRAGAMVLRDRPDALHVRLDGPAEQRLDAAVARSGRTRDEVRRDMEANDRAREAYVRHFYRCDPGDAAHYHLVVDSTAFSVDTVVEMVVAAAKGRGIA